MKKVGKKKRPGGRTEKNRRAVATAVLELIRRGNLNFEIQEVAALSGVHRTTIFRRWPDRAALLGEALQEHVTHVTFKRTGKWQTDLRNAAFALRDYFADPVELAMNRMFLATENEEFLHQALRHFQPVVLEFARPIREAQEKGQIPDYIDTELVTWMMVSAVATRSFYIVAPNEDEFIERLVSQIIRMCSPPAVARKKTVPSRRASARH